MTVKDLLKIDRKYLREKPNWAESDYNEGTEDQLEYYLNTSLLHEGAAAYLYDHANDKLFELNIQHIIKRSADMFVYDSLIKDDFVLVDGEDAYNADTSAEFITDNDCYLVWFSFTQ